jgi:DNA-binding NtrC family response regulator
MMPANILVADDDKSMLGLYARIFSGAEYSVSAAGTFAEASEMLRSKDFDLLVTDLEFPDGVGTELIRLFIETKAGARSLLVTGSASEIDSLRSCGAADCIEKPFKVERFMEAVSRALA